MLLAERAILVTMTLFCNYTSYLLSLGLSDVFVGMVVNDTIAGIEVTQNKWLKGRLLRVFRQMGRMRQV